MLTKTYVLHFFLVAQADDMSRHPLQLDVASGMWAEGMHAISRPGPEQPPCMLPWTLFPYQLCT